MTPSATNIEPSKERYEKRKAYRSSIGRKWVAGGLAEQIAYLQEDSLVNHSPKPDEEKERKTTATSGLKCYESYENSIRGGSSLKMLVASLLGAEVWYSNKCTLTWKVRDTKCKRLLFQLSPSMRHTDEIGSGLLLAPSAVQIVEHPDKIRARVAKNGYKNGTKYGSLSSQLMYKYPETKGGDGVKTGLRLQPNFVEWMMGYPKDWTEIPDSKVLEMRSYRKSQRKSCKR